VTIKKKLAPNFDWSPSPPVHGSTWEQTVQIEHLSIEVSFIAYSSSGELKKVDLRAYLGALTEDQKKELGEIEKLIGVECNANTSLILSKSEEKVLRCICLIKDSDTAEAKNQKLLKLRTELEQKLYNYEIDTSSTYSNQNRVARQSLKDHIRSLSEAIKANEIIQVVAKNELTTILHTQSHDKVAQVTDRPYP
jgi:hypothetical protein